MSVPPSSRRRFLKGAGLTVAALAGCVSGSTGGENQSSTASDTPSPSKTATATQPSDETPTETETETETETSHAAKYPWFKNRGTVVDSFDSFEEDWEVPFGKATLEDEGFLEGPSVRMDSAGGNRARITRNFLSTQDFSGVDFTLALNLESTTKESFKVAVVLRDHGGNYRYHSRTVLPSITGTWVHLNMAFEQDKGSFDPASVSEIMIESWTGNNESVFRIDDLRTLEKPEKAAVMFTFDDACPGDYEYAYPVLSEYDYAGVCFPPSEYVTPDTVPSVTQYQEMRDGGWDIGGHLPNHQRLSEFSKSEQRALFKKNVRQLRQMGLAGSDEVLHFRTPFGNYNSDTLDVVLEEFGTCIAGAGAAVGSPFNVVDPRMIGFRSGENLEEAKELIDHAVEHRQLLGFTLHARYIDREHLEKLVEYVHSYEKRGDLEVLTMSDFYERSLSS